MSVGFDPSTDFEDITDGLEAVTLNRRGSSSDVSVAKALRRMVSTAEIEATDGRLQSGDVRWHLPNAQVTTTPRLGDWVVDGSANRWRVLMVEDATLNNRWVCVARNLRVVYGLEDTVTIERAVYSKGDAGAAEEAYNPWRTGVRARIQEESTTMAAAAGALRATKQYTIFMEDDFAITQEDRIVDRRGNIYRIESLGSEANIGRPFEVEASEWRS